MAYNPSGYASSTYIEPYTVKSSYEFKVYSLEASVFLGFMGVGMDSITERVDLIVEYIESSSTIGPDNGLKYIKGEGKTLHQLYGASQGRTET